MEWATFISEINQLAEKINIVPDIVIGIARGGVIPGALLARRLNIKDMLVIKVRKEGESRKVVGEIVVDVAGKTILLVEDMLETGSSLVVAKEYFENKGAKVKTACLYTMPITQTHADYSLREVQEVQQFPWE